MPDYDFELGIKTKSEQFRARNAIVEGAIGRGCDWILMIDDDMIINIEQKLNYHLFKGYPNLCVRFDTKDFLKGAALDQMNFAVQGVSAGIISANEAREYLNMPKLDGHDELISSKAPDPTAGASAQDTGGGGGNQKRRAAIGTT